MKDASGIEIQIRVRDIQQPTEERAGYVNMICTIAGVDFGVGGGWLHNARTAYEANCCAGRSVHIQGVYWPGQVYEGDFDPYEYSDIGYEIETFAQSAGLELDEAVEMVQQASADCWRKHNA